MVDAWFTSYQTHKSDTQTMMAFSNQDGEDLNQHARSLLRKIGDIGSKEFTYSVLKRDGEELGVQKTKCVDRSFSVGDQLVFTRNDNSLDVKNGTLGRIKSLDQQNIVVTLYDKDADTGEQKEVSFSPNLYNHFDNGWAVTLHKNQGVTVDRSFVLASFEHYKNLSYVAMTRHVKDVELYISSTEFWRDDKVFERLGRAQEKLSSLDYVAEDKVTDLLRRDENHLLAVLDQVGHHLQAIGYVGKRQFETVWSRFFNKPLDRNLIYVDPHVRDAVRSEAERFDEKYNTSETLTAFTKELDSQSPEELFRQLYPKAKLRYTDEANNHNSQASAHSVLSEKAGLDI